MKTMTKIACAVGLLAMPAMAHAQATTAMQTNAGMTMARDTPGPMWRVSPFVGTTFSGDATSKGVPVGISAGWMGHGGWGAEVELADNPTFFEQTGFLTNRRVTTVMGNVTYALPGMSQRLKPYVVAGLGMIRPELWEAGNFGTVQVKEKGYDVGAGIGVAVVDHVSVHGDVRYFRAFGNTDDDSNLFGLEVSKLHFVRASVGMSFWF